jgi:hypothetical protein
VPKKTAKVAKPTTVISTGDAVGITDAAPHHNGQATSQNDIRLRAYQKWEAAGKPECDGTEFWLEAERELLTSS